MSYTCHKELFLMRITMYAERNIHRSAIVYCHHENENGWSAGTTTTRELPALSITLMYTDFFVLVCLRHRICF